MKKIINGIEIDVRSNKSLYITIGDYTYYIDDLLKVAETTEEEL